MEKIIYVDHSATTYVKKERSFRIPNIDANKIEANYKNGMLQVTMPKVNKEEKTARQININ